MPLTRNNRMPALPSATLLHFAVTLRHNTSGTFTQSHKKEGYFYIPLPKIISIHGVRFRLTRFLAHADAEHFGY